MRLCGVNHYITQGLPRNIYYCNSQALPGPHMQDKADSDQIAPRAGKRANPKKRKLAEISGEAP